MKKVFLTSAFALFALTFAQAQVSSSCADGSCTITTPCNSFTGSGTSAKTQASSRNGVTTYKGFIDGVLVLECTAESAPLPPRQPGKPWYCSFLPSAWGC